MLMIVSIRAVADINKWSIVLIERIESKQILTYLVERALHS